MKKRFASVSGTTLLLVAIAWGCSSSGSSSNTCVPGQQIPCTCPGGATGSQTCASSGTSFDECRCSGAADGGATDSGSPGEDGGSTADSGGGTDSGSDSGGSTVSCPSSAPASGAPCSSTNLLCEYGSDPNSDCNQQYQCSGGQWQAVRYASTCPTPNAASTPGCPATYGADAGSACSSSAQTCGYPGQGLCECNGAWVCDIPGPSCPTPRPRIGSACSTANQLCDYGFCKFTSNIENGSGAVNGGIALRCNDGIWQPTIPPPANPGDHSCGR